MPERIACFGHHPHQCLDCLHGRSSSLNRLLAADGLQSHLPPPHHQHAHAVAANNAASLVGQHKGCVDRVERFVHGPAKAIDLHQCRLLRVQRNHLPAFQIAAGHQRHLLEKLEIALLHIGLIGMVKHLDEAGAGSGPVNRCCHDQ